MSADNEARCERHVGEVFPPRCSECESMQAQTQAATAIVNVERAAADLISDALAASGMTLDELSDRLSAPRSILQAKLEGSTEFSVSDFIKIAYVLGADPLAWTDEVWHRSALAGV